MTIKESAAARIETIKANIEIMNNDLDRYSIANRVTNRSFVVVAREGDTCCLTEQDGGHNFGGGPCGAVTFTSRKRAEEVAANAKRLFESEDINPVVMGLGDAYRARRKVLLKAVTKMEAALTNLKG